MTQKDTIRIQRKEATLILVEKSLIQSILVEKSLIQSSISQWGTPIFFICIDY